MSMMAPVAHSEQTRDAAIDLVKTLAIVGVVIIHLCSFAHPFGSADWTLSVFLASAVRASVPLFFMCSGALFLDPGRILPTGRLWRRYIPRIAAALFVWAGFYALLDLCAAQTFTPAAFAQKLRDLLLFRHEFHLYYLHITLLFYALIPVVRVFTAHATQHELGYALGIWFAVGILYPTLCTFYPFSQLSGIPAQWLLNMSWASVGYGLLGYYLKRYPLPRRGCVFLAACGLVFTFGATLLLSYRAGQLDQRLFEGMSIGPALMAAGIFGLCRHAVPQLRPAASAATAWLSRASFCIYLVHVLFLRLLNIIVVQNEVPPPRFT